MEIMEQLGLADKLLEFPHTKMRRLTLQAGGNTAALVDLSSLKTKYPDICETVSLNAREARNRFFLRNYFPAPSLSDKNPVSRWASASRADSEGDRI